MKYSYFQGYSLRSELLVGIVSSTAGTHEVGPVEHLRLQFPESRPLALWSLRDVGPLVGTLDVLDKRHEIIRNYLMTYIAWIGQCSDYFGAYTRTTMSDETGSELQINVKGTVSSLTARVIHDIACRTQRTQAPNRDNE
jgi:hypothetical protein